MNIRGLLIITFCLIVIIPMTIFWAWPYSKALDLEIKEVNEKHLVIAKNLSTAFERYYQDVLGVFSILETGSQKQVNSSEFNALLKSFQFLEVAVISEDGKLQTCIFSRQTQCQEVTQPSILTLVKHTLENDRIRISTVTEATYLDDAPVMLVVKRLGNQILLGYLSTEYIIEMGKRVAFGEKGHAAIVDQAGQALAHPLPSWVQTRKDMSQISAVQKMLAGKTGVDKFYSPALKGDMIAGYTYVPGAGWGVMVPQPIKELEGRAIAIDQAAIMVMLIGVALACLFAIPVSLLIIKPLENLSKTINSIKRGESKVNLAFSFSKAIPQEISELKTQFANMMETIEAKESVIAKLAYFDSNTGLPNRNYFYRLSNKALDKMIKFNQKGALVFIDFDGFKEVNDTYGHKAGDELLYLFGQRLIHYFELNNLSESELVFYDSLPKVIPARLGGDEFVILLQDVQDKLEVSSVIKDLLRIVFEEYKINQQVSLKVTGSAGVALFPKDGNKYDQLMRAADLAMYDAKSAGKNTVCFTQPETL
ncbi:sensor domain-containing diguanylate cyclase [Psychromonas arctica]|uniref:sensor domain-containing diguanylate cyclase n=1 Tax=Psychromonas arctica TaxID=168275 RepID=UPI002FD02469